MAQILKLALVALTSADELGFIQSKVQLAEELPQEPKGLFVELASFTASSVLMTVALVFFIQWAARDASLHKKGTEAPVVQEDIFTQFMQAVKLGDESFEELLRKNPNLARRKDAWGASALHVAAASGASVALQSLLKADADVNARDGFEDTPLHLAAASGELCCIIALLDASADLNAVNSDDATPIQLAAKANQKVACEMLLEHGAMWNAELMPECEGLPLKAASMATVSTTDDGEATSMHSPAYSPCSYSSFLNFAELSDDGNTSETDFYASQ